MVSYQKSQIVENLENNVGNDINLKNIHLNYINNIYLSSVKREVEKHFGEFKIFSLGNTFSVEINIPISKTKPNNNSSLQSENLSQNLNSNLDSNKKTNPDPFYMFLKKLHSHIFNIIKIFFPKNT